MYRIAQFIRHKVPYIWYFIEYFNCLLFSIRYGKRLNSIQHNVIDSTTNFTYSLAHPSDTDLLVEFFNCQPQESFEYFKPHNFDKKTIRRLINNRSFIMLVCKSNNQIIGYAFLRCFFNGKAFRGKIVDIKYRGKGIAKQFGLQTTDIALKLGMGLFGTISKSNISSIESSKSSNQIKLIEELPDGYMLIQYLPKN